MANPKRYSQWKVTFPFSLNSNHYGISSESHPFTTPTTEADPLLVEFNVAGSDPSGFRHLTSHPSFSKILASGVGSASLTFPKLDLNATDISPGSGVSKTKVFLFRVRKMTSPGVTLVHNMKLWVSDTSDFLSEKDHKILYKPSKLWLQNFAFVPGDLGNKSYWLDNKLPEVQNLFRTDSGLTIHGSGDADVSEWAYIALAASGILPLGEYGGHIINGHPSGFLIRVTYNVDNIFPLMD